MSEESIVLEPQTPQIKTPVKPAIPELSLSGEQASVLQTLMGKPPEALPTTEAPGAREMLVKGIRDELQAVQRLVNEKIDWQYSSLPSENRQAVAANRGYPQQVMEHLFPGVDFNNITKAPESALLQGRYQQNERVIRIYNSVAEKLTPIQKAELARLHGEQVQLEGYLNTPREAMDLSPVDRDFAEGGQLALPEQQGKLLAYRQQFESQIDSLLEQSTEYSNKLITSFKIGNRQIEITQQQAAEWSKLAGAAALAAMLLIFLEGEGQGQGKQGMGH